MTALLIALAAAAVFLVIVDAQDRAARRRAAQKRRTYPAAWDEPSRLDRLERDGLDTFRRDDGAR
jgi:hypothetical protein